MSQALEKRGIAKNKIKNITNWADGGEVFPIKIQKSNDIVFQYFGNIKATRYKFIIGKFEI